LLVLAALAIATPLLAHDSWISRGGHRNTAGEWCCGEGDCAMLDPKSVTLTSTGYVVSGWGTIEGNGRREFYHEGVPEPEAQPSLDGAFWRCKRPDGTRRCFFAPPPNT
jgi:hypothetical protein